MNDRAAAGRRRAGILLHPTSLPGPDGIGDLGREANLWIDWLAQHGQSMWQVLPLGPTSYGDSPYQTLSAFAGNPLLVSLERLARRGWLKPEDLERRPALPRDRVDYGAVIGWKTAMLDLAWQRAGAADRARTGGLGRHPDQLAGGLGALRGAQGGTRRPALARLAGAPGPARGRRPGRGARRGWPTAWTPTASASGASSASGRT